VRAHVWIAIGATLALLLSLPGCARRDAPYRFRAPLVASVSAAELPPRPASSREPAPAGVAPRAATRAPAAAASRTAAVAVAPPAGQAAPVAADLAESLRTLVGGRDREASDLAFALAALDVIRAPVPAAVRALEDGAALFAFATERGAVASAGTTPLLGDLVVFDRVVGTAPASLVGVVLGVDERETVEFLYLGRGVVRRGWLNLGAPSTRRDDAGRVLNTIVRHSDGRDPRGTRYLAGELFSAYIRLDRLGPTVARAAALP
jgi:hypothetical protein